MGRQVIDASGNTLTDAQGRSFTWNFENRLTQGGWPRFTGEDHQSGCPRLRDVRSLGIPAAGSRRFSECANQ